MAKIKIKLPDGAVPCDGKAVTFRAPCDCTDITEILIEDTTYSLVDSLGNSIVSGSSFVKDAMVSVILDKENSKAYLQNGAGVSYKEFNAAFRGPCLITESCTFDLSTLGIKIGDTIHVMCVGGGGGGIAGAGKDYDYREEPDTTYYVGCKGGTGFGAGGGGVERRRESSTSADNKQYGGYAGDKEYISIVVDSLEVPVIIGEGGKPAEGFTPPTNTTSATFFSGGTTSFGTYLSAEGGTGRGTGNSSIGAGENGYIPSGYIKASQDCDQKISGDGCVMIWW